ncbi:hypothetical protein ACTWP5_27660 [Streptomyces sp. 4N509B]|uniref:hypothetical protein n=1 Tax=Streptomyces sp. 4N509B TaxID=3457413 RepID=UPI003FD2591B
MLPLTLDRIETEATYFGVRVSGTEEGDLRVIGTHDLRRVIASLNCYTRVLCRENLRTWLGLCPSSDCIDRWHRQARCCTTWEEPQLSWAVFRTPAPERGDDPDFDWYYDLVDAGTPGAIPIVVIPG